MLLLARLNVDVLGDCKTDTAGSSFLDLENRYVVNRVMLPGENEQRNDRTEVD